MYGLGYIHVRCWSKGYLADVQTYVRDSRGNSIPVNPKATSIERLLSKVRLGVSSTHNRATLTVKG